MKKDSQWKSSTGFILASAGAAIGLGAIWKFPYMAGMYGGGAFLLMFFIFILLLGLPLLITEFIVGKMGRTYSVKIFEQLTQRKWTNIIGWNGNFIVFVLFGFYSVIGGWIVLYIGLVTLHIFNIKFEHPSDIQFEAVISNPLMTVAGQGIFILLTAIIVMVGVENGIEKASKVMMPLLLILLLVIVVKSLSLEGASEGVKFFLQPKVEDLTFDAVLFALGQSFFALSLGTLCMTTYAVYAPKNMPLKGSAISIVFMNIAIAILAGLAIFPALNAFGYKPQEGPGLLFKVMPMIFEQMKFGVVFYLLFLILFLFAALTSSISLLELNVSNFTKNNNNKRKIATIIISISVFAIGVPAALSFNILSGIKFGAGSIFDNMDYLVSNILLPLNALATTIVVSFFLNKEKLKTSFGDDRFKLYYPWYLAVKYLLPIAIAAVFILQFI